MTKLKAQPAPVQEFGLTRERFNALEAEITTLQSDWLSALKEVVRLKAAQPEQELVATLLRQSKQNYERNFGPSAAADWIYSDLLELLNTTQPQRPWVDLTDEEISALSKGHMTRNGFARNVLAKSKEKNNAA